MLPVFLPYEEVHTREGTGCFCLYHGNLSVAENEQAVMWLLKKVFQSLELPLIISGKQPSARLSKLIEQYPQACLIADPSEEELQDLILKAQINILPSLNCTGVKLKLLNALFNGRHCIVNSEAVEGTGLESICHLADGSEAMRSLISELYTQPMQGDEIRERQRVLGRLYNQQENVNELLAAIW
jgi:glycosyltransferase involved in cell wall biosynthesis